MNRWRHKKRGSTYIEVGTAELQTSAYIVEGAKLTIYRSEHDERLWARPEAEFKDGRFEPLPASPPEPDALKLAKDALSAAPHEEQAHG
jgi:hypothetical protein